ncbi:H-NS histone family protein [Tropicimonas aquimaris]|uniref:H-NS family nucleoid-associated regulatory protein n=1 Tax=Tropicimonas aquimaris TaxID=914152 RepID=A0ABW3ISX9_9RHOB
MAKKIDLEKLSIDELRAHAKDVQKAIEGYEARQRKEALAAAKAAARQYGFELDELTSSAPKKAKAKVPPKYANPENPELTWSGRGRKPAWVNEALERGVSLEDLAI